MKKILILISLVILGLGTSAQEAELDEYTKVITGRADKIVNTIKFKNDELKIQVRDIIVAHYLFLNNAQEEREADVAKIREEFAENQELRNLKIDLRKAEQEIATRDHHFSFNAQLKNVLTEKQIDQVKDGLTYGVLNKTYNGFIDMIPDLKEDEKDQILVWLFEAREHAIDGGSSGEKHNWFGKYKGKINNYLSGRGYDLNKLGKEWHERLKKKGIKL